MSCTIAKNSIYQNKKSSHKSLVRQYQTQISNLVVLISPISQKILKTLILTNQIQTFQNLQNHQVIRTKLNLWILSNKESKVFIKKQGTIMKIFCHQNQ